MGNLNTTKMDFNKLRNEAIQLAVNNEICKEWLEQLKVAPNVDSMLDMYIKGIDFCFSNEYPSNHFMRRNLKGKMEHKGIFLDETISLENNRTVVCLGDSRLNFLGNEYLVSEIFLKDRVKARVVAKDCAFITIDIFDNVELEVEAYDDSKVNIHCYKGAKVTFKQQNNSYVKVTHKSTKTYK